MGGRATHVLKAGVYFSPPDVWEWCWHVIVWHWRPKYSKLPLIHWGIGSLNLKCIPRGPYFRTMFAPTYRNYVE